MFEQQAEQMDLLAKEILRTLQDMSHAKDPQARKLFSEIIKNLVDSQGVYLDFLASVAPPGMYGDDDFEDDDEDDDFEWETEEPLDFPPVPPRR